MSYSGTRPADDVLIRIGTQGSLAVMPPPYQDDDESVEGSNELRFSPAPSALQGSWMQLRNSIFRNMNMTGSHDPLDLSRSTLSHGMSSVLPLKPRDPARLKIPFKFSTKSMSSIDAVAVVIRASVANIDLSSSTQFAAQHQAGFVGGAYAKRVHFVIASKLYECSCFT